MKRIKYAVFKLLIKWVTVWMKTVNQSYNHKILFGFPTNKALEKDKKNFFLRVTVQVNSRNHPFFLITAVKKKAKPA